MTQRLPPDELGVVGENMFRTLCGQARLVCNKSDRDVTGWDFIVEFPMAGPDAEVPLDQRPAKGCHVQLKSTAGENGSRISAKLSAVERFAKDPRPALIVVFRLRSDGQPLAGYVIHLIGDELARVLHRLRLAEAKRAFDLNRATISFDYRKGGVRFDLSPDGLKAALEAVVGDDPAGYVQEKQRQLAELGYEDGGLEGEALIWIEGPEHFNEIVLGLSPIRPERLKLFDRRFGIRIPYRGALLDSIEEFRVELPHLGNCDVIVRGGAFAPAAVFNAEMFVPPPMVNGPWLLVRHPDFMITFREDRLNFQTSDAVGSGIKTLDAWATLVRALSYLADGRARLSIERKAPDAPLLSLPVDQRLDGPYLDQLPAMTKFLDGWQRLLEVAGMKSVELFAFETIWYANAAAMAVDVLLNLAPIAFFEFDSLDGAVEAESVEAIYFNSCTFAGTAISYSVKVTLQATAEAGGRYRSTAFKPLDVRPAVSDLEEYGMEQAHRRGLTVVINPANVTMVNPNEQRAAIAGASADVAE
jgi:hypothetical protein